MVVSRNRKITMQNVNLIVDEAELSGFSLGHPKGVTVSFSRVSSVFILITRFRTGSR